jgi:hypothetical protein
MRWLNSLILAVPLMARQTPVKRQCAGYLFTHMITSDYCIDLFTGFGGMRIGIFARGDGEAVVKEFTYRH